MKCDAILVAAGRGRRMGFDKLMAPLAGKTVLQWSLDAFLACDIISRIVIVTDENRFSRLQLGSDKEVLRVDGGRERFLSVAAGLDALENGAPYLAVHDGARPLVLPAQIDECFRTARDNGAAALARRLTETIKKGTRDNFTRGSVPRDELWFTETPQVFRTKMIVRAYQQVLARRIPVTDEVSAAEALGIATKLVENTAPNLKITVPSDLVLAAAILATRQPD
jgi:2-C-methyl-D-erythritol 4-phosphate cytidylyltransferase